MSNRAKKNRQISSIVALDADVRIFLLTGVSLAVLVGQALADDLPIRKTPTSAALVAYDWTGFYAGGHLGVGWGSSNWGRQQHRRGDA